ncbi:MAG: response regulator transcription factor [Anaerolineae bacterium]
MNSIKESAVEENTDHPLTILVVDDEPNITEFLRVGLGYEGYQVTTAADGREGLRRAEMQPFDLVVLDVMLPGMDGFEVCRRLRAISKVPVLMLTARDEVSDRVTGLDTGADDYLTKPFSFVELLARVRAILRRAGVSQISAVLQAGDVALDREARTVQRAGRPVALTSKEFDLLEFFMSHPRQVFRREAILDRVWGYDFAGDTNLVDVHIGHLRDKLDDRPARLIQTVRGVGYMWQGDQ